MSRQNRAARDAWLARQSPRPPAHPEPEVRARDAQPDEIPRGASIVIKAADKAGWRTKARYARGTDMSARGLPTKVVDNITVAGLKGVAYFVASWTDGSFDFAYLSGIGDEYATKAGATALKAFIKEPVAHPSLPITAKPVESSEAA